MSERSHGQPNPIVQQKAADVRESAFSHTPHARALSIPVVVIHTVRLVGLVHNEGGPLQGGMAHHTGEALGMVGVTSGLQHPVCDGLLADTALFQGALSPKKTSKTCESNLPPL